ncbi:MAG: leucine-rich repeat domain-containing protein [Ruminococcus sp.]|nr:leucine-rich repeat domain-containing protein [Ruminococcus sp.]
MTKMKKIAAMTAALLLCASTMGYLPQDSLTISNVTANAAEEEITSVEINAENFPDENFRNYVKENFDTGGDDVLSAEEIAAVTELNIDACGISDLTGIEYFTDLAFLNCNKNNLTALDVSNNTALQALWCYNNQLTTLDLSNNTALEQLYCTENKLSTLDLSKNTELIQLFCSKNQLTSLDVSNNAVLRNIECNENQLTSLDVSNNPALTSLNCSENQLTSLDTNTSTALKFLNCSYNQITSLDVSSCPALTRFECNSNQLTSLDTSDCIALNELSCFDNNLTSLDLSSNTALTKLDCSDNNLTSLDVSNNTALTELNCISNAITSLDFSKNTALTKLYCGGNELTSLDLSNNTALKDWIIDFHISKIELTDNTFDLSTLPAGFDVSKTSEWTNGTVEGNILTVEDASEWVTYKYDCGNGHSETFTLVPTKSAVTPEKPPVSLGDINADGLINSSDATLILSNYSAIATGGDSAFSAEQTKAADINNDGKCDSIDASLILAYYAHTSTGGTGTIEEYLSKSNADEQLKALREKKESEVQLFAAAYIGCTDDMNEVDAVKWIKENSPVFYENYSFVEDIPSGQIAGTPMGELYCIVPFDENSTVAINRAVYDENGSGSYENVIYRSESGEPVLLFCNNSGVDGDTMVTITDSDGNKAVWFPSLDEKLMMNCPYNANYDTFVYDFSQYQEILEKGHTSRKNSGWNLPTAADLRFTNWSGVDYRGSEVIGSYKIEFGEDTAYIKWVDGDEEHEFNDVEWTFEYVDDAAVVTFNFNEFAGILQYNFLLNETGDMLYTAVNFTNEDTLDENLKLYRILDRYEYSEQIS